jgi:hypothetical protein
VVVHHDLKHPERTDDVHIVDCCVRGRVYRILVRWRDPYDLELNGRAASIVDGDGGVLDVDVIDCYNYTDKSNEAYGVV